MREVFRIDMNILSVNMHIIYSSPPWEESKNKFMALVVELPIPFITVTSYEYRHLQSTHVWQKQKSILRPQGVL